MTFSSAERRGIHLVVDRLRLIQETWGPKVSIEDIEHLAGLLRELLPGRGYLKAWNLMAPVDPLRSPRLVAPALEELVPRGKYNWARITFAQTAGLETSGMHWWTPLCLMDGAEVASQAEVENGAPAKLWRTDRVVANDASQTHAVPPDLQIAPPGAGMSGLIDQEKVPVGDGSCYKLYKLSKYLDSACLIHMGRVFTRAELVKNYANKYGAIHIEWTESGDEHRAMAEAGAGITISDRNPVLYELLSIGQTLVNSEDARILRSAAEKAGLS